MKAIQVTDDERAAILAAYGAGHSLVDTAGLCGVSRRAVTKTLAAAGVAIRPRQKRTLAEATQEQIRALKNSGKSAAAVARLYKVHPMTVARLWNARALALGMGGKR